MLNEYAIVISKAVTNAEHERFGQHIFGIPKGPSWSWHLTIHFFHFFVLIYIGFVTKNSSGTVINYLVCKILYWNFMRLNIKKLNNLSCLRISCSEAHGESDDDECQKHFLNHFIEKRWRLLAVWKICFLEKWVNLFSQMVFWTNHCVQSKLIYPNASARNKKS